MFIIELTYKVSTAEIDAHMAPHVAFLEKYYQSGTFVASGRKEPRDGGIILAVGKTRKQIEDILQEDPFQQKGLADYRVIEFKATKKTKAFDALEKED
ncbi:MAG: GTP cyclohydrolase [Filimonas sp.]|nr:GTP cyclohydrolase [Filimonas sp.]